MAFVVNVENLRKKIIEIQNNGNQKVCVVGIIGRCHLDQKDQILNKLVDHNVFQEKPSDSNAEKEDLNKQVEVKMFYDEEQKTVFLELNSVHDTPQLFKACKRLNDNLSMAGHHRYWQDQLLQNAAALLFIFSVSHIVVVMFPTPRFDLSFLRLFKLLASARYNMLHSLSQSLASVDGIPEIWRTTGRPCIPRIIFSFQMPWSSAKGLNETSLRKLQQSLQDQLHLILKKNRLLGSLSSSSLFTVSSPNQLFVHVQSPQKSYTDPISFCINHVLKNSINMDMLFPSKNGSKSSQVSVTSQQSPAKNVYPHNDFVSSKSMSQLRDFLYKQIDYMMTVESREVPAEGRRGTHVEAPNILLWYKVCEVVFEYFLGSTSDNNTHIKGLAQTLDLDWKFSENRCHKVTPMATSAYLDNLPSHYIQSVHLSQLSHCLHVFGMNARGPAYEHFANQLQEECNQIWWNGRHLCEATSMTGQPCVYPYHNIPTGQSDQTEDKTGVPLKSHSSRVTSISACNCGRTQGTREDPFDLKMANYDFYQDLEKKCCSYLIHIKMLSFPIDDPSVTADKIPTLQKRLETHQITILGRNANPAADQLSVTTTETDVNEKKQEEVEEPKDDTTSELAERMRSISTSKDYVMTNEPASLSYNGYQSTDMESRDGDTTSMVEGGGTSYYSEYEGMMQATKSLAINNKSSDEAVLEKTETESANTSSVNHFEGMFTTNLPTTLLPLFPSWSLIVLGSASLYNPVKGVEQVGFFSGSNYLLLWDIPIKINDSTISTDLTEEPSLKDVASQEEQWPAPGEINKVTQQQQQQQQLLVPPVAAVSHVPFYQTVNQVISQSLELLQNDKANKIKRCATGGKDSTTLKSYIGNEYECPRGHRFFCSASDKMVKASASGHVRENAVKLVTANMPLYFPCPCRSSKPLHLAQLTRTYVVTPDSSVTITLNPRVQPGEREITPIFTTGIKDGITLPPNSYCVLRYPYVYVDENGPILPPAPTQPLLTCRLMRGMFNYSHVNATDETV